MPFLLLLSLFVLPFFSIQAQISKVDSTKESLYRTPSLTVSSTLAAQDKPATYSELGREDIHNSATAQDLPTILSSLPSLFSVSQNGNSVGYTSLSLRGFDQRRIAVMINGVPQNDPEDHDVYWINTPDIFSGAQSVQVQRGAGLMNYGAAPMAGSVSIQSISGAQQKLIRYSQFVGFQQLADYTNGKEHFEPTIVKSSLELQSGLIDTSYSLSVRLSSIQSDGYRLHSWAHLQSYFVSASKFDKNLTMQVNVYGGPINDALAYTGTPKSWIKDPMLRRINMNGWVYDSTGKTVAWSGLRRPQEIEEFSQPHYELLHDWTIDSSLSCKSTLFYYTGDGFFDYDASWADAATLRLTPQYGFIDGALPTNTIFRGNVSNKQGGWVPRIVWNHDAGIVTAGAELRVHRSSHWGNIRYAEGLPLGFDPDYKVYSYNGKRSIISVFAREEWFASDDLTLLSELQLVHHTYGIEHEKAGNLFVSYHNVDGSVLNNGQELFSISYLFSNPRLGLNYRINDFNTTRMSLAYTSREPRMRNLYAASDSYFGAMPLFEQVNINDSLIGFDFTKPLVKPEHMLNVELGWQYSNQLTKIGLTAYLMEFFDELVKSGRLDIFGVPVDGNAPRTRHLGLEFEAEHVFRIGDNVYAKANGNCTFSYNRIIDMTYFTANQQAISLNNNPIAGFPDLMGFISLGIQSNSFQFSINAKHIGSFRTDNFGDLLHSNAELINDLSTSFTGYYVDNIVDSYTVFGMDAQMDIPLFLGSVQHARIRMQIMNLFDTLYASGAEGKEFFPGQRRMIMLGAELEL